MKDRAENIQLPTISVDVQLQPNGRYDLFIATEGSSGCHYRDLTADQIGEEVADMVALYAEAIDQ